MKKITAIKVVSVLIAVALTFAFSTVEASQDIAISPLNYEFDGEKGDVFEDSITVMNTSEEDVANVEMEAEDMFPEGEEGRVTLRALRELDEEDQEVISMARWITFEPAEFSLDPRESKDVDFVIEVPENADPGGHYAGIIAGIPSGTVEGGGVGITNRVAARALLTVDGDMVEDLSMISFDTTNRYYEYGPVVFESRFENDGTVHITPDAKITIEDLMGRQVAELEVEGSTVLPNSIRRIETQWNEERLWRGKYEATLTGVYGEDGESLGEMTTTFYAFPWKYGLAGILVVVFFILTRKRWITILKILVKGEAALKEDE